MYSRVKKLLITGNSGCDSCADFPFLHSLIVSRILFRFGQCALPTQAGRDRDLTRNSGLRFGTRRETYLEFNRKLRIKRRASFGVEFKTIGQNGIIFYAADEKNNDFITLFLRNGLVSPYFNQIHVLSYILKEKVLLRRLNSEPFTNGTLYRSSRNL